MDLRDTNQIEEGHYILLDSLVKCGANSQRLEGVSKAVGKSLMFLQSLK